jgi:D-beta-D-heptose 7-phosphate kinase / D-beta-D-heptose 1-phosphate adenosyltransferase
MKVDGPGIARVLTAAEAAAFAARHRAARQRVVFTNGVFDILHPGHVRYLQAARARGDVLIVGVNADESVRRDKGPGRPVNPEQERAEMLAALDCVDAVVIFRDSPDAIIRLFQPDIHVKGTDRPVEEGFSTTALLERIKSSGA